MKNNLQATSMTIKSTNVKSKIDKIQSETKQRLFNLIYILLKDSNINLWFELICLLFQGMQLLAFPLNPIFASIWKSPMYLEISNILQYFHFTFKNKELYFIIFYSNFLLIVFLYFIITYLSYSFSNSNNLFLSLSWKFLKSSLSLIIGLFYLPILNTFLFIFSCINSEKNIDRLQCWSSEFIIHGVFGIIGSILIFFLSLFTTIFYIETRFAGENPLAKYSTRPDVCLLLFKTILVIIFTFFCNESSKWLMVLSILISSCYITLMYFDIKPYYNYYICKSYNGLCAIFSWSSFVLLLGTIFKHTPFNGSLSLFIIGIPIISSSLYFNRDDVLVKLLSSITANQREDNYLDQIKTFLQLINRRNSNRKAKIELKGYILQYEEKCILTECPLKKYLNSVSYKDSFSLIFLLQHAEGMYQSALGKFPSCITLRCSYAFFLLEQMNKKRQAAIELENAEQYNPKLGEQFVIFRYKKFVEEHLIELNSNSSSSLLSFNTNMDVVSNLAYKNYQTLFKSSIEKGSGLYIDFWSLLLNRQPDNHDDIAKLNDYGTDINVIVENIHDCFDKMQKIKPKDHEVIKHYADFLNDILNNKDKAIHYKNKLSAYNEEEKEDLDEFNPISNDLNALNTNDEYQFIIVSAQTDKFGLITNISLGICNFFGYTKTELIGKPMELLMPDTYHKGHREVLIGKLNEFKKQSVTLKEASKKTLNPTYREIETFGKNKSRYLIPLVLKTAFISTESNDLLFIGKIWKDQSKIAIYSPQQGCCFILTNNSFIIRTFTVNALKLLNMHSSAINANIDITEFINQFHEEFLFYMTDNDNNSQEQKLLMKKTILGHKFRSPSLINWRHNDQYEIRRPASRNYDSVVADSNITDSVFSIKKVTKTKEDGFILTISDIVINNKKEGYLFRFDSIKGTMNQIQKQKSKQSEISINGLTNISYKHFSSFNVNGSEYKKKSSQVTTSFINQERIAIGSTEDILFNKVKIDQFYIPEQSQSIQFDPKSYSFKINPSTPIELRNHLKVEAFKKINNQTKQYDKESVESSSSSNEWEKQSIDNDNVNDDDDSGEEEGESNKDQSVENDSHNQNKTDQQQIKTGRTSAGEKKYDDLYFKVNMNHIKYSIYDYNKQMIIEIKDYNKIDQVQIKLSDNSSKDESPLSIKPNLSDNINNSNILNDKNYTSSINPLSSQKEINDHKLKEASLIKKIEYSLRKEENHPTITKMRLICFLIFIIFLCSISGLLGLLLSSFAVIKENIHLIEKAFDLIRLNALGIYYVRELTLINNNNYTSLPDQRDKYTLQIYNSTQQIFTLSNDLINYIITSSLQFSSNSSFKIYNSSFYSAIIEETESDFTIKFNNLSSVSSFLETNTALFHIGHTILTKVLPTNKDVFYYLFNSLNGVPIALKKQGFILLNEFQYNIDLIKMNLLLYFIFMLLILVGIYFLLANAYDGISKRKESYLEVFFEIGSNVIKASLEKCENFVKKLQMESIQDDVSIENNENCMLVSNGNKGTVNNNNIRSNNSILRNTKSLKSKTRFRANKSKESQWMKGKFIAFLFVIGLFILVSFVFYVLFLKELIIFMKFYSYMIEQHNEYLMLFNALREYMFDSNSKINLTTSIDYIEEVLDGLYNTNREQSHFIQTYLELTPDSFSNTYRQIYKESACVNDSNYSTLHQCESIMSNSSIYGLEVALMYYVEDIRFAKNYAINFKNLQIKTTEVYNLTLSGTDKGEALWPLDNVEKIKNYSLHDSINQFIQYNIHLDINIMFILILIPNFERFQLLLKDSYELSISTLELVYITIFAVVLGIIVGGYILLWLPYEKKINQTIYKTKNMLSILPKEVLASLSNIHRILNISKVSSIGPQIMKTS